MPEQFLHGVEVVQIDDGLRPISTTRASVIGAVGTAADADAAKFPLNTPVLVTGPRAAAALGTAGTLPAALNGIYDQAGAWVVVIRVEDDADAAVTKSNVIGGVDPATGQYLGIKALVAAQSTVHVTPRIIVAPGFSHDQAVATEIVAACEQLKAVCVLDGPNTTDAAAIAFENLFGSKRVYIVDPWVKVWDTVANGEKVEPASARVAGMISKSDQERGFWWSPSNRVMNGITGTAREVDFALGDPNARANYLNENNVATIIQQEGYRLWGNRTSSADQKWAFLSVVRTVDMVNESILRAHLWAVDRNITKTYLEDVTEGVNAYLRHLKAVGAILGGRAWADKELNSPDQVMQGKVYFDFEITPPYPAEHITFRSHLVETYIEEIFS